MQKMHNFGSIRSGEGLQADQPPWPEAPERTRQVCPVAGLRGMSPPGGSDAPAALRHPVLCHVRCWRLCRRRGLVGVEGGRPAPADELRERIPAAAAVRHRFGCGWKLTLGDPARSRCLSCANDEAVIEMLHGRPEAPTPSIDGPVSRACALVLPHPPISASCLWGQSQEH